MTRIIRALSNLVPTGSIQMFGGASAPFGWLILDGSAVSRTTFAGLFEVIGTTYGAGDGSTTFNLPNFTNRVPTKRGANGAIGGADTVNLQHNHGGVTSTVNQTPVGILGITGLATQTHNHTISNDLGSVSILPQFLSVNFIIKT